jgi:hypothetical protein
MPYGRGECTSNRYGRFDYEHKLLFQCVEMIRAGRLEPISPINVFDVSQIAEAFTYFGSSMRIGKIVISFEDRTSCIPVSTCNQ